MALTKLTVSDKTVLKYPVGFPVAETDLVSFINGNKVLPADHTFDQLTNSVTFPDLENGDEIVFRIIRSK